MAIAVSLILLASRYSRLVDGAPARGFRSPQAAKELLLGLGEQQLLRQRFVLGEIEIEEYERMVEAALRYPAPRAAQPPGGLSSPELVPVLAGVWAGFLVVLGTFVALVADPAFGLLLIALAVLVGLAELAVARTRVLLALVSSLWCGRRVM